MQDGVEEAQEVQQSLLAKRLDDDDSPPTTDSMAAVDGLRFFAYLSVFYGHFGGEMAELIGWQPLITLSKRGNVGQGMFFLIGGFVPYVLYHPQDFFDVERGYINRRKFWIDRISGVYPVYLISLLLSIPILTFVYSTLSSYNEPVYIFQFAMIVVSSFLWLESWTPYTAYGWSVFSWALSVFAYFWFTFPLLCHSIKSLSLRLNYLLFVASYILSVLPFLLLYLISNGETADLPELPPFGTDFGYTLVRTFPPFRLSMFVVGMTAARVFIQNRSRLQSNNWIVGALGDLSTLLTLGIAVAVPVSVGTINSGRRSGYDVLFDAILSPLMVVTLVAVASNQGLVAKLLSLSPIQTISRWTSIYIYSGPLVFWHSILIYDDSIYLVVDGSGSVTPSNGSSLALQPPYVVYLAFWGALTLCIVMAALSFGFIEKPMQLYASKKLREWLLHSSERDLPTRINMKSDGLIEELS